MSITNHVPWGSVAPVLEREEEVGHLEVTALYTHSALLQ